jgi:anti-anti-sigma regulatory factor
MLAPVVFARTDRSIGAVIVTVSGPLTTWDHVAALKHTLESVPRGFSLIIELDAMTTLSAMGLSCLRDLAKQAMQEGVRLLLVSESLDVRANLVLSDLDSFAPVLHSLAQARHVVVAAA